MAPLSRRQFLGSVGVSGMALPFGAARGATGGDKTVKSAAGVPIPGHFTLPFRRPVPIGPTSSQGMTDYFDVRAYVTRAEILPGVQTEIFSYNGTFPGPTFCVRTGRRVVVRTRNHLPVPVTTHLHGGHTPAATTDTRPTCCCPPASAAAPVPPRDAGDPAARVVSGQPATTPTRCSSGPRRSGTTTTDGVTGPERLAWPVRDAPRP